jgi:hypothetical protein
LVEHSNAYTTRESFHSFCQDPGSLTARTAFTASTAATATSPFNPKTCDLDSSSLANRFEDWLSEVRADVARGRQGFIDFDQLELKLNRLALRHAEEQ